MHLKNPKDNIIEIFKEMLESQRNLFDCSNNNINVLPELKTIKICKKDVITDFLWCDICKAEIWNTHLVCKSCSRMLICAFCFKEAQHSKRHDVSICYHTSLDDLEKL